MKFIGNTLSIAAAMVVVLAFLGYRPSGLATGGDGTSPAIPKSRPDDNRKPLIRRPLLGPKGEVVAEEMTGQRSNPEPKYFENHAGPSGEDPQVDFPENEWIKNIGSKKDGAGMCVFSSFEMMMLWHGLEDFRGFRNWCAERYPGGGYPDKLEKLLDAYCKAKGIERPQIIQYVGDNPAFLEQALSNGWMPCVTLSHSPRYGSGSISHMVDAVHLTPSNGAIMDNNFKDYEWWPSKDKFMAAIKYRDPNNGRPVYWAVAVKAPGPPPIPKRG